MSWKDMTAADRLDSRLAEIAYLIDTAVIPDDGYRCRIPEDNISEEVVDAWYNVYIYGPAWDRAKCSDLLTNP